MSGLRNLRPPPGRTSRGIFLLTPQALQVPATFCPPPTRLATRASGWSPDSALHHLQGRTPSCLSPISSLPAARCVLQTCLCVLPAQRPSWAPHCPLFHLRPQPAMCGAPALPAPSTDGGFACSGTSHWSPDTPCAFPPVPTCRFPLPDSSSSLLCVHAPLL